MLLPWMKLSCVSLHVETMLLIIWEGVLLINRKLPSELPAASDLQSGAMVRVISVAVLTLIQEGVSPMASSLLPSAACTPTPTGSRRSWTVVFSC